MEMIVSTGAILSPIEWPLLHVPLLFHLTIRDLSELLPAIGCTAELLAQTN
jgi:hypothetical protein